MPSRAAVFVMTGCPACHEYIPRIKRVAGRLGVPLAIHDITKNPRSAALANAQKVKATPTTFVQSGNGRSKHKVGAISDADIEKLLGSP
jgi:glutaredoxin